MPSKPQKPSRPSPSSSSPSRTPPPLTPLRHASPTTAALSESHIHHLLSEASAIYPNLLSSSALTATISYSDPSSSSNYSNHATLRLSKPAMLSSSLSPGSLVSVSLPGTSHLDSFADHYACRFSDIIADDSPGCYFAIATVFSSPKVVKNGVELSWGLSATMGFPETGRSLFVSPISASVAHIPICKFENLRLSLVPPKDGVDANEDKKSELDDVRIRNGSVGSPRTPASRLRYSSPGGNSTHSGKSREFALRGDSSSSWDISAARFSLADEKVSELLEKFAAQWLYDRRLLIGNFVVVPICGQHCIFQVEGAYKLPTGSSDQCLLCDKKDTHSSDSMGEIDAAVLVGTKTKIHLADPSSSIQDIPKRASLTAVVRTSNCVGDEDYNNVPRLGGLSKEFADLRKIITRSLGNKNPALPRYKGVLLHGPTGTGKTSLVSSCVHDARASLFTINGPEIVSPHYGESEQTLHEVFNSARKAAPAVVFIDELDAIAPARKDAGEDLSLRLVATLLKLMDEISRADDILLIAATNRPDSIDPALRRPGRFDREIEIKVPSPDQRLDILLTLLSEIDNSLSNTEIQSLALATHGFIGVDLHALCNEAAVTALRRVKPKDSGKHFKLPFLRSNGFAADMRDVDVHKNDYPSSGDHMEPVVSSLSDLTMSSKPVSPVNLRAQKAVDTSLRWYRSLSVEEETLLTVTADDFKKAKMRVRPSSMREVMLELPNVHWEDVGGQAEVKQQLIEAVVWPQLYPEAFQRIGIRPPSGLLMIGPPGCSKTLMARAVASEAKLNFLAVKGPELFNKWVGESEKAVRSLFAKARANAPAIIFFDEIDGLAITRGQENDGTSVADRVLSQLLVEMDGLVQRTGVTVIGATNRPDKIDPALLRTGRFDRLLDVQPPNETDREDIFRIHTRNTPCSSDVCLKDLARLTEGYTGADIKLICREAAIAALEESIEIPEVSMRHYKAGIGGVHPSDLLFYKELASQFRRMVSTGSLQETNQFNS